MGTNDTGIYRIPATYYGYMIMQETIVFFILLILTLLLDVLVSWQYIVPITVGFTILVFISFLLDVAVLIQRRISLTKLSISDTEIVLEQGKFWYRKHQIPRRQITSVKLVEGWIARRFSVASLEVTAWTTQLSLPVLDRDVAQEIANILVSQDVR